MVADELAADQVAGFDRRDGFEDFFFFVADGFAVVAGGALHGDVAHDLEDVVLDDVADGSGLVVEGTAALDAEVFGHGDLDALDEVAVPEGFEEGVGEAEGDDVVDGAFGEVVVDAEDGGFGEGGKEDTVELLG